MIAVVVGVGTPLSQEIPFHFVVKTTIATVSEVTEGEIPLVTSALKYLVAVKFPIETPDKVDAVSPAILVNATLSVEDCH